MQNPVKIANEYQNPANQFRMLGNAYAEYEIIKDLKFRVTAGADLNYAKKSDVDPFYPECRRCRRGCFRAGYQNGRY